MRNFEHMTPCLSHNFPPVYLKRNTTTRLLNLRTLLCMQLLTYETVFEYIVWPIRRSVRRVHCKKNTTLHNVLTYRVMPVCKYSHTRTCLCAMCRAQSITVHLWKIMWQTRCDMFKVTHRHDFISQKVCTHPSLSARTCRWTRLVVNTLRGNMVVEIKHRKLCGTSCRRHVCVETW